MRLVLVVLMLCLLASQALAESGIASIYANGDGHEGSRTANGERVNPNALTCAHKSRPFGQVVTVTAANGRQVRCRVNDRGPFIRGRVIDLTPAGARALGFNGLMRVTLQ